MAKISKFLIISLGVFLLLISLAHAASFDAKVTPIKDKIVVDETAEFDITIENNLDTDQEYIIKKAGYPFWDMYTEPLQNPITLNVPAQSSASIRIFVHPLYITSVDTYTLAVGIILESTGQEQKVPITIGIKSTEPLIGGYIPTVLTSTFIFPEKIDPRKEFTIKIDLNNQNVLNYPNITIKIESNLFKDQIYIPLGPREEKSVEIKKKLDDMTPPQLDQIVVAVFKDERLIVNPIVTGYEITEYSTQEELPKDESFLKIRKGTKVISNNPNYKGTIKVETSQLKNLFLSANPKADTVKENDKMYLVWQVELDNERKMEAYTTENYRPIVVAAVLVIIALVLYFVFRSPIIVRKSIANVGTTEGGISEAKIVVRVKNRSANQITNIEVLDNLSHIAHVEKEISIGSVQPHSVLQHPKKGMLIKWTIEALEPGDERVLSYKMKSRLPILGEFNLPAANARCKIGDRVVISNSNRVSMGG
ncbi:hypothetical protein HYW20_04090 [Candidatus Woesearchaeota archaeon]|nr:hypothetical protein [Candidatus Woesearchaeota archaeon]